jgi:hypothetical protein
LEEDSVCLEWTWPDVFAAAPSPTGTGRTDSPDGVAVGAGGWPELEVVGGGAGCGVGNCAGHG